MIQALKIKTLSEELQDYKIKSVKGLQGYICLMGGLQDYKRGRITKVFLRERESYLGPKSWTSELDLETEPVNWTSIMDLSSVFKVCLFIDEVNHGKPLKVT